MNLKFIFMLWLIFYICENVSSSKAENVSLPIKKLQSVINSSATDVLKANQGNNGIPASQENVQNASNYSWGSWNSSSNHTKSSQTYFGNKNIIIKKEKGTALPRNDSAFVEKIYANLSTNVANVSLHGLPVNTTTPGKTVQLKMMKPDLVGKYREKENITSNSTRYASMVEVEPTKEPPRQRWIRAKTDSVESLMNKLFGEDASEPGRKRQRQPDGSRERSSRRRQKMKQPGRFGEGEVFYFRDAETTETPEAETTESGDEETTTASETETTPASEAETTIASGEETTTASGEETTTASGEETTSENGETATGEKTTITGPEGTGPNVNYHYHFHYFGASPPHSETATSKPPV